MLKVRLDKQLLQEDLAKQFGVSTDTIRNWEKNRSAPQVSHYRHILEFLEYNPFIGEATSFGEQIKQFRFRSGLSHKELAAKIGVNATTVAAWERGGNKPSSKSYITVLKIIEQRSKEH